MDQETKMSENRNNKSYEIHIAGQRWTVRLVNSHDPNLIINGDVCLGTAWPAKMEIYISNELTGDRALRTIRHELAHAFLNATQCFHNETFTEEEVCDFVAIWAKDIVPVSLLIASALGVSCNG